MDQQLFREVRTWMYRNARPLELALWRCRFEGGDAGAVVAALAHYQNEDGGFGHALEPDCWNPQSSPYQTLCALNILREIGFADKAHPLFQGILRYLESGADSADYGWRFSIPSNDACPRAPWWSYDEQANRVESIGLTAALCAFVLTEMDQRSPIYPRAKTWALALIPLLEQDGELGEMGLGGLAALLPALEQTGQPLPYAALYQRLGQRANAAIARDPAQWSQYLPRPSRFIQSPASPLYPKNAEVMALELQYLLDTRAQGGVWPISWSWFDLADRYAAEFAVSENWWKARQAIDTVALLSAFGKIDLPPAL